MKTEFTETSIILHAEGEQDALLIGKLSATLKLPTYESNLPTRRDMTISISVRVDALLNAVIKF